MSTRPDLRLSAHPVPPLLALAAACSPTAPIARDSVEPVPRVEPWNDVEDELARDYDDALQRALVEQAPPGVAMAVARTGDRTLWTGAAGLADLDPERAWGVDDPYPIGSVTKTFTASLVLLLVEDAVLDLDDPLQRWVPGFYDDQGVSLRHLMSNTSGIASYNYVGDFDESARWTPEQLVQWAVDHEPAVAFEPGSAWEYSNTNWVLLGLAIEAASGQPYVQVLHERLLDPLSLEHTVLWGDEDYQGTLVRGYQGMPLSDATDTADPSFGWAAGAIVSTPGDLARWAGALYGGEVLGSESLALMTEPTVLSGGEVVDYGMGAFVEEDPEWGRFYGHTGGISGHLSYMFCLEDQDSSVIVFANSFRADVDQLAVYPWQVVLGMDLL